jgi:hypothetical protein
LRRPTFTLYLTSPFHTVVTIYTKSGTKGAKHESIDEAVNIGAPSLVGCKAYAPASSYAVLTSLTCPKLQCSTFPHIPRSRILFSLAPYQSSFQRIDIPASHGAIGAHSIVTLSSEAFSVIQRCLDSIWDIDAAVKELERVAGGRGRKSAVDMDTGMSMAAEQLLSDSESDSGDET